MKFFYALLIPLNMVSICFAKIDPRYGKFRDKIENSINFQFPYHNVPLTLAKKILPDNPVIIEAGAFDGSDSVQLASLWPEGKIYSFEPVPEIFRWLKAKTWNKPNIRCFPLALSDQDGFARFHVSEEPKRPNIPSMSGSLLAPKEHLTYSSTLFKKEIEVQTITIDSWAIQNNIDHVDFLWLDMQGYELNAIKASPEILRTVKAIYTEIEFVEAYAGQYLFDDIYQWMTENGFELVAQNVHLKTFYWFGDALFVRKELVNGL